MIAREGLNRPASASAPRLAGTAARGNEVTSEYSHSVTGLLRAWRDGDRKALDRLIPRVQDELRKIAAGYLRRERQGHTLQTTALVNEAYLRLVDQSRAHWKDRTHFLVIAAQVMRRVLVDHARKKCADKRGAGATLLPFEEALDSPSKNTVEVLELDDALETLAAMDPRLGQVVELRYFGGLTIEEVAAALEISPATVKRDWTTAKSWLQRELRGK